jgi:hypothetical protein
MRLSTRSSVDLRQSIFTEAFTDIMFGLNKRDWKIKYNKVTLLRSEVDLLLNLLFNKLLLNV